MKILKYYSNKFKPKENKICKIILENDDLNGGRESLQKTWLELKDNINNGQFKYNDVESVKKSNFISVLNVILNSEYAKNLVTVDLSNFARAKKFCRAVIIERDEVISESRFIPNGDFMKSSNRFSPIGVEWLYLGFDKYMRDAEKCCRAEVRASDDANVEFCEFKYIGGEHKVIDLTVADDKTWDDVCSLSGEDKQITYEFVTKLYCKLLSEELLFL